MQNLQSIWNNSTQIVIGVAQTSIVQPKKILKQTTVPSLTNDSLSMFEKKFFNNSSKLLNGFNSL